AEKTRLSELWGRDGVAGATCDGDVGMSARDRGSVNKIPVGRASQFRFSQQDEAMDDSCSVGPSSPSHYAAISSHHVRFRGCLSF
uniref:Pecanex-like protein n=1 Tax=Macrostomum lignano TaxID=282301 RepID=A0A1I8G942_9PLAT